MKEIIQKLTEAVGPSGYEHQVRELIREMVADSADEVRVDALGNLIARKGTLGPGGKRIMLAAHMDELGVMVTKVDEKGFVRFTTIGGIYRHTLPGGRVRFLNGTAGVISSEPVSDLHKVAKFEQMYIDVGATSPADCPVKVGDVAAFERPFVEMGRRYVAKAMDDRVAAALLVETLRRIDSTPNELHFVFTVQEEVGLRGAKTAAYGVDPDLGVAVDVTDTGDTPRGITMEVSLGKGPALKVMDSYLVVDPRMVRWAARTAEAAGIPFQYEVLEAGGTDAGEINATRAGAPSICISIPTRYIHTPSEMVDREDLENTVRLLVAMLSQPVVLE